MRLVVALLAASSAQFASTASAALLHHPPARPHDATGLNLAADATKKPLPWKCCDKRKLTRCTSVERGVDPDALPAIASLAQRQALLIVGEQKAGTTFLFELLAKVPGIDASKNKETNYFRTPTITACNLAAYLAHFRTGANASSPDMLLEASPEYLMLPLAARQAVATLPRARIVVLARDPVERAHAAWDQQRRESRDRRPFFKAMREEITAWRDCDAKAAAVASASGRPEAGGDAPWRFDGARWFKSAIDYETACARYFYFAPSCPKDHLGCKLPLPQRRSLASRRPPFSASTEYLRGSRETQRNMSTSRPWRRRDPPQRNIYVTAAASPRPASTEYPRRYLHKARVATHVDQWLAWYPQDQVAVINASHLYENPGRVLRDVATFAGLAPSAVDKALASPVKGKACWHACRFKKRPLEMAPALRGEIEALIAPERARMATFLEALDPARV